LDIRFDFFREHGCKLKLPKLFSLVLNSPLHSSEMHQFELEDLLLGASVAVDESVNGSTVRGYRVAVSMALALRHGLSSIVPEVRDVCTSLVEYLIFPYCFRLCMYYSGIVEHLESERL
jgi:hypothetical protein